MKKQILIAALMTIATGAMAQTIDTPIKQPAVPAPANVKAVGKPVAGPTNGMPGVGPMQRPVDELTIVRQQMERFDTNHDGKISKEEFLAPGIEAFNKMDANHDGFITAEEMVAYKHKMDAEMAARMMAQQAKAGMSANPTGTAPAGTAVVPAPKPAVPAAKPVAK